MKTKGVANGTSWVKNKSVMGFFYSKFVEFCRRTDLHGYKYIVMDKLNIFERCCWALAMLVSIGMAACFVATIYDWYARNPIVTVIESTQGAIWDIPFPAVTICNLNFISQKAARLFADNVTLPSNTTADEVFRAVRLAPLLHSALAVEPDQRRDLLMLQSVLDLNSISVATLVRTLSPASTCDKLVKKCMWKNTIYRCDALFEQVFTYFSLCCTFNYYAVANTPDKKRSSELFEWTTPRRVASCGYQTALTVLLDIYPDDYYSTSVASQGALVFIDNAHNMPDVDSPVRLVNPSTEVLIALSPERTYTTSGIKAFPPQERQCYYHDEVTIDTFQYYSFHNCIISQRVKLVERTCGCTPYYYPAKDKHRTCNFSDVDCLQSVLMGGIFDEEEAKAAEGQQFFQCLPECEHYEYPLEVAFGKLATNTKLEGLPFFNDVTLENRSLVNVFFNDLVSTRYRRDVYLNWQNLLAAFGGLLSLMLGFTLISGFDLILYTFETVYASLAIYFHDGKVKTHNKHIQGQPARQYTKNGVREFQKIQIIEKAAKNKIFGETDHSNLNHDVHNGYDKY